MNDPGGKGPVYVFADTGVEVRLVDVKDMQQAIALQAIALQAIALQAVALQAVALQIEHDMSEVDEDV